MEPEQDAYAMHYGSGDDELNNLKAIVAGLERSEQQWKARAEAAEKQLVETQKQVGVCQSCGRDTVVQGCCNGEGLAAAEQRIAELERTLEEAREVLRDAGDNTRLYWEPTGKFYQGCACCRQSHESPHDYGCRIAAVLGDEAKRPTHREKEKAKIHLSHVLGEERSKILAPCGTPRFYGVRECTSCGAGMAEHPAGLFIDDELFAPCAAGLR